MVSFFGKIKGDEKGQSTRDSSSPLRMDLAERQAFRREMLYQAIRESMISMEVNSSMYRFKIMNLDKRHHRFIVMIDVTKSFHPKFSGSAHSLFDIEEFVKKHTFDRFGLTLEGIYWRVSDTESPFRRDVREGDSPGAVAEMLDSTRQEEETAEAQASGSQRLARHQDSLISDEEKKAFLDAIRRGTPPPAILVGDREYHSDVSPLEEPRRRK